ncbi:Acyltransferase family protein [Leishmania donovani]|uniref:Acyltransferase family protein n=1 Tax=Leishmania donovani TaxID=5661 RepID=A0A504XA87_LEIDO|nr:Acyltransferase family protein [Leishmania donovani]
MSDASASPSPSVEPSPEFTLRDYVVHQRVLQQLLRSQPVWLLDDVLSLRYRARLRLCLSPRPQLHFTEDAEDDPHSFETDRPSSKHHDAAEHGDSDSQASAMDDGYPVVPLTPACSIEPAAEAGEACGGGLRLRIAPGAACGAAASADSLSFLIIPASTAAGLTSASAWVTVLRRLCRLSSAPPRVSGVVDAANRLKGGWGTLSAPCHADPVSADQNGAVTPSAINEGDEGMLPIATPTPSSCNGYASSPAPVEAPPVSSPAHLMAGAILDRDVEEDRRQLERLTEALRARTREAAELKAQLRQVTTTTPSLASARLDPTLSTRSAVVDSTAAATPAAVAAGEEVERPPTMAHVGSGLVPALQGFPPHLAEISNASSAAFVLSEDSARPQAPRSGHVCNLGSLGPTCGDEDALRIYNEIHGVHETAARLPHLTGRQQGALLAVALGTGYTLLRQRLVPKWIMQKWFLLSSTALIIPSSALVYLIDPLRYLGVPRRCVQSICVLIFGCVFKAVWWVNPQIRMHVQFDANEHGKPGCWDDIARTGTAFTLNHTSFWDAFVMVGITPMSHLIQMRTLMKSSLRKIPIFGGVFDRVGHFPVHFKSGEDGNFHVDKEKQAIVSQHMRWHLRLGGSVAFFPEGAVNKTPETLQPFRYGTFATVIEHRLRVYYVVSVGSEKTWPPRMACGGLPADVHIRIGAYPIDFDRDSSRNVAVGLQVRMQQVRDEIAAEVAAAEERRRRRRNGPVSEAKGAKTLDIAPPHTAREAHPTRATA